MRLLYAYQKQQKSANMSGNPSAADDDVMDLLKKAWDLMMQGQEMRCYAEVHDYELTMEELMKYHDPFSF